MSWSQLCAGYGRSCVQPMNARGSKDDTSRCGHKANWVMRPSIGSKSYVLVALAPSSATALMSMRIVPTAHTMNAALDTGGRKTTDVSFVQSRNASLPILVNP